MSVLLFPPSELNAVGVDRGSGVGWLTAMGAVATAEVVSTWIGREATIKWPNDVRVGGRKIAGILVERPGARSLAASSTSSTESARSRPHDDTGRASVIGIGLNVNLDGEALPIELQPRATSIRIQRRGQPVDRSEVARDLIRRLDHWYETVRTHGYGALNVAWRMRSESLGRVVRVTTPTGVRAGRLVDLDLHLGLTLDVPCTAEDGQALSRQDRDASRRLIRLAPGEVQTIEHSHQ
jgi:BirA family biotin operon repressor/biotin-[acetyl-CoA-carboxylase] ligase